MVLPAMAALWVKMKKAQECQAFQSGWRMGQGGEVALLRKKEWDGDWQPYQNCDCKGQKLNTKKLQRKTNACLHVCMDK